MQESKERKKDKNSIAIWWIRRDLRLTDNQALAMAMRSAEQVLPLFIFDTHLLESRYSSPARVAFLMQGLARLAEDLLNRGSRLVLRSGNPPEVLHQLMQEVNVTAIYAEEDFSPYARQRDAKVAAALPLHLTGGLTMLHPSVVVKPDGSPYTVFTPFSRKWSSLFSPASSLPAPERLSTPANFATGRLPEGMMESQNFPAGEQEAARRLHDFIHHKMDRYSTDRDRMDLDGTSVLSPYLCFGMLSARQAVIAAQQGAIDEPNGPLRSGSEAWLNELIWREFYLSILYHFPHARRMAFKQQYREIRWVNDPRDFASWKEGLTGYPVVDAAMRQLNQTGWMHNRARMITASFLTKDLLVDWRGGEEYFMQHLIDGDPAANNGGWQWSAGTGSDAAPYFRIFNPVLQGEKFDPNGKYVRRWVPELALLPDKFIHRPWELPAEIARKMCFKPGDAYPLPIVDHAFARQRALAAYKT